MTKPYGWKLSLYKDEDFGPSSKYVGAKLRHHRGEWRRLLHKKGRRDGDREIESQLDDVALPNTFVCAKCSLVCHDDEMSGPDSYRICMWCDWD